MRGTTRQTKPWVVLNNFSKKLPDVTKKITKLNKICDKLEKMLLRISILKRFKHRKK